MSKAKPKIIMHERNKLDILQAVSVKKNQSNFINVIGEKFVINIRSRKLTTSFCKKLLSCTKFLQLVI